MALLGPAPVLATAGTSTVAIVVTVVATVVILALAAALARALRAARELRAAAEELRRASLELLGHMDGAMAHVSAELERVDDLIGSAEVLSETVGSASRLAYTSVASPLIKMLAFARGVARGARRLRHRTPTSTPTVSAPSRQARVGRR
jgi:hypothetical protein